MVSIENQFGSVTKSCLTLCYPMDCSMPGLAVHHHPRACSNSCPSSQWCHPAISSFVIPFFSCPQSFPASGSFQMSQLFESGGQSTGVLTSTSVPPMNTQDWSPLGWTSWISLQSNGLFKSLLQHHSLKASILQRSAFFMGPTLTSIHDYWKNRIFDYMELFWQSDASAF